MNVSSKTIKTTGAALAASGLLVAAFATTAQAGNSSSSAQALKALQVRSEALNRQYHLGGNTTTSSVEATQALQIRGNALNQRYHLGDYAVVKPVTGFDWTDAGVGAASMLGLIATAGGLFLVSRRNRANGGRRLSHAG